MSRAKESPKQTQEEPKHCQTLYQATTNLVLWKLVKSQQIVILATTVGHLTRF